MNMDKQYHDLLTDGLHWNAYGGDESLYGTLKIFFESIEVRVKPDYRILSYDYRVLSETVGSSAAWMLIYQFSHLGWINYGTSPRFGWLEEAGVWLHKYVLSKTVDELIENHQREYDRE